MFVKENPERKKKKFLTKVNIFRCFDVCSVQPPQIFQVLIKISTVRPVFPDYLSVPYDYVQTYNFFNLLSANPTKWSNTLKQILGC